jgi:DNA-binding response OmpR family regulator
MLADIKMPVMDGIALALHAAKAAPGMPILLMTGFADQKERAHGLDQLIHDVITKPFTLDQVTMMVEEALDR